MGLLKFSRFSAIPNLLRKIQSRRQQKEKYTPSFTEWAILNGTRIVRNTTSAGTNDLFTVPAGKVLFITAVHCCVGNDATPNARGLISIGNTSASGVGETMLNVVTTDGAESANESITFNHLVKVDAGEIVQAKEVSSSASSIGFIGFELPRSLEIV